MAEQDNVDTIAAGASSTLDTMLNKIQPRDLTTFAPSPPHVSLPPTYQPPQGQFGKAGNEFSTVSGRKRADREAAVSNVTNAIKTGIDFVNQRKQRALSMDIERLLEAQQGLAEAQQQGNKAEIERNTQIINDITRDPKKAKQLEKAFNISLVGGGKNQKENQAFFAAWQQYQKKIQAGDKTALNPTAQRLMQQQPSRLQESPESILQGKLTQQGVLPKAGELITGFASLYRTVQQAKTGEERTAAINKAADARIQAAQILGTSRIDQANILVGGRKYAADVAAAAKIKQQQMVADTWASRIKAMEGIAGGNQATKNLWTEANTASTEMKTLATQNTKLQTELNKLGVIGRNLTNTKAARDIQDKIDMNSFRIQLLQQRINNLTSRMKMAHALGLTNLEGSSDMDGSEPTEVPDDEVPED